MTMDTLIDKIMILIMERQNGENSQSLEISRQTPNHF